VKFFYVWDFLARDVDKARFFVPSPPFLISRLQITQRPPFIYSRTTEKEETTTMETTTENTTTIGTTIENTIGTTTENSMGMGTTNGTEETTTMKATPRTTSKTTAGTTMKSTMETSSEKTTPYKNSTTYFPSTYSSSSETTSSYENSTGSYLPSSSQDTMGDNEIPTTTHSPSNSSFNPRFHPPYTFSDIEKAYDSFCKSVFWAISLVQLDPEKYKDLEKWILSAPIFTKEWDCKFRILKKEILRKLIGM